MKRVIVILLVLVSVMGLIGCSEASGPRTLVEITTGKSGGPLRYAIDAYTTITIQFFKNNRCVDGHTNCCQVSTNYYKDSPISPTGKLIDRVKSEHLTCKITEHMVTIEGFDNYTYSVRKISGTEYVEFSKPFLGFTKLWYR